MDKCPECGCKCFYTRDRVSGIVHSKFMLDGSEAENGELHQGISYKTIGKSAYCERCEKRISLEKLGIEVW